MDILKFRLPAVLVVVFFSTLLGCRQKKIVLDSPPNYNFAEVFEDKLDLQLKEISGLAWDRVNNVFLAHYDEAGKLFYLDRDTKSIKDTVTFGKKADYEDITLAEGIIYILKSEGIITRIQRDSTGIATSEEVGKLTLEGKNDFETMYYDSARKALILICKNCDMDDKQTVSAFAYYIDSSGFVNDPVYTINADSVQSMAPEKTSKFQPSAAAIHPVLKKLFIISSASNLLVIADLNGRPESVYKLSKKLFPQPEGITFNNTGDMYISNEGVDGRATILRFEFRR